ncbi:MAG: ribosome silencing factor [Tepidisphaeraceae bacterium]
MARLLADTRCTNVRILDMSKLSPVCDFFVLATGTSSRQMRSVADDVAEYADDHNLRVLSNTGTGESWTAIDLVDVVVHIFTLDARMHYDLDNLWADAQDVDWKPKA